MIANKESVTQKRVIEILTNLGYEYLGDYEKRENNSNIETTLLRKFLKKQNYGDEFIKKAVDELIKASKLGSGNDNKEKLYNSNKKFYENLLYGVPMQIGKDKEHIYFIDFKNPKNNKFYVAKEVTFKANHEKRPDLVIYINGIAVGVIELKSAIVDVAEGIRQNITNQNSAITEFFTTVQFVIAGNESQGLRYGTTLTSEKYFLSWKEYDYQTKQSKRLKFFDEIVAFFKPERILDILENFILFDKGVKKLCRANQYFGVKCAQKAVQDGKGGIIWHTQGSGKSLSMVWLAKWIKEFYHDGRVLLITDRIELDEQIEGVFAGVNEKIVRTKNAKDLLERLNLSEDRLICSLIHKFGKFSDKNDDGDEFIAELKANIPSNFKPKGKIIVFVDECHRTQSGKLHKAMKEILGGAIFIGFTGTPLLKKDKATSLETFGRYIHTYKFDEAVSDEVVLDLRYEARDVSQNISDQEKIDKWFEAKTRGLNDIAKAKLKKIWGNMQTLLSSKSRLEKIALDIIADFGLIPRLDQKQGNAMLVADSIYNACRYWKIFQNNGFKKCAVVTSYSPYHGDVRTEDTGEDKETKRQEIYNTYLQMLGIDDTTPNKDEITKQFENNAKQKFKTEPANMQLLIVVDKLLTGFDAPSASYLYIDKKMQDHALFQAVCRVNRLDGESKDYGYIVDYMDLFKCLEKSITDYTGEAFGEFEKDDVTGLLKDKKDLARKEFDKAIEICESLLENVAEPKSDDDYREYFCCNDTNETAVKRRYALYKAINSAVRSYANFKPYILDSEVGYTQTQAKKFGEKVKNFIRLKEMIMLTSGDSLDFKAYEADMRFMIDNYIEAGASKKLCDFEGMSLVELIVEKGEKFIDELPNSVKQNEKSIAEMIENHIRKIVTYEYQANPEYYEKMSVILENLINLRKEEKLTYAEYLQEISNLAKQVMQKDTEVTYPKGIDTKERKALYDNLEQNKRLAIKLDEAIKNGKPDKYKENQIKIKKVKQIIKNTLETDDESLVDKIYKIVEKHYE